MSFPRVLPLLAALVLFPLATEAAGASAAKPAPNYAGSGQTVKTEYFSVKLPAGWIMPEKLKKRPGGVNAVFADEKSRDAVTISVLLIPASAEDFAKNTMATMKKGGLKVGALQKVQNYYVLPIKGKPMGEAWFACDGKMCAATVILGEKIDKKSVDGFLSAFKPANPALFPKRTR